MKDAYNKFYIYNLIDPKDNIPFYVGKGYGNRMYSHEKEVKRGICPNRNSYLFNSIKKILDSGMKIIYKKIKENLSELDSFKLELEEIKKYGRRNNGSGILCNMSDGGEGMSGYKHTEISRKKISESLKGRYLWSESRKKEASKKFSGKGNPFYGKTHTDEVLKKISITVKNKWKNESHPLKGRPKSESHRKNIKFSKMGRVLSDETKNKMSISQRKRNDISEELKDKILELYNMGYGCKKILKFLKENYLFNKSIQTIKSFLKFKGFDLSKRNTISKKVKVIFNGEERIFDSIGTASKYLKCGNANLSKYLNGKKKSNKYNVNYI